MTITANVSDMTIINCFFNPHSRSRENVENSTGTRSKHFTDYFERSSIFPKTYGPATKTINKTDSIQKPEMDYSTRESKDAIGDYYNSVLNGLRAKYEEPEAMRRFDEFMQSEGYVSLHSEEYKAEYEDYGIFTFNHSPITTGTSGAATFSLSWADNNSAKPLPNLTSNSDEIYQVRSDVKATHKDGQVEYYAESFGIMHSDRAWSEDTKDAWRGKSAQIEGLDTEFYLDAVPDGERRTVVGASNSIGDDLRAVLEAAGITLGAGESLVLSFEIDPKTGGYSGKINTGRDDIDAAINRNSGLLASMNTLRDSIPGTSLSGVPGQYQDGVRKVSYSLERQLVYSPDNSSAVVATDIVNIKASGYTYVKKVADEFYPSCDSYRISLSDDLYDTFMGKDSVKNSVQMYETFVDDLNRAIKEGTTVKSTITEVEYNEIKAERKAAYEDYAASLPPMKYLITADGPIEVAEESGGESSVMPTSGTETIKEPVSSTMSVSASKLSPAVTTLLQKYKELAKYLKF